MPTDLRPTAWACRVFCTGLVALPWLAALAQETPQRVAITGSSIKRTDAETALPVQVLTRKDVAATGVVDVEQLLQTVSALTSSGATVNSSASGATTGGLSGISLRGLTSLRTLVLINGRRVAPYGIGFVGDPVSVDVNSIPLSAIERVEVQQPVRIGPLCAVRPHRAVCRSLVQPQQAAHGDPALLLRGAVGKGFRAPSLQDLYLPVTNNVTPAGTNDPIRCPVTGCRTDCSTQFTTINGGNPDLYGDPRGRFVYAGVSYEFK